MYSLLRLPFYTDDSTLDEGLQVIEDDIEGVNCIANHNFNLRQDNNSPIDM